MPSTHDERPNLLILLTDQQPAALMSCAGNRWLATPAMDQLAASGTRFTRAYCSNPVCLPSRTSLMTGRYPSVLNIRHNDVRQALPVTPELQAASLGPWLARAGYRMAYGGKTHLPPGLDPRQLGFEYLTRNKREELAAAAAAFIRRRHEQPWCLIASFTNPHDICYQAIRDSAADDSERRLLATGALELATLDEALQPPAGMDEAEFRAHCLPPLPANHEPQEDEPEAIRWLLQERPFRRRARDYWTEWDWRRHAYALARLTERVDSHLQEVLEALHVTGQQNHTVVVFSSDHGDLNGAHRLEHKTALYEEAVQIPLIVSWPGHTRAGAVCDEVVSNGLDLFPTLCDYAGIVPPAMLPGHSLRAHAEGRRGRSRQFLGIESQIGRAIVSRDHKYIQYDFGPAAEQLYDRRRDPGEMRNAVADTDRQEVLEQHREWFAGRLAAEPCTACST